MRPGNPSSSRASLYESFAGRGRAGLAADAAGASFAAEPTPALRARSQSS